MSKIEYLLKKISYQLTKFTITEKDYFEALDREYTKNYEKMEDRRISINSVSVRPVSFDKKDMEKDSIAKDTNFPVFKEEPWTKEKLNNPKCKGPYKMVRVKPSREIADTIKAWCVQRNSKMASMSLLLKAGLCLSEEEAVRGFNYLAENKKGTIQHMKPWGRPTLTFIFKI